MMKKLTLILFFTLLVSTNVTAKTVHTTCNWCVSSSDFSAMAKSAGIPSANIRANNIVYVMNFSTGQLRKYNTSKLPAEPGIAPFIRVIGLSLTSEQVSSFRQASTIVVSLEKAAYDYEVPSSIAGSAYDMVGASYVRNNVAIDFGNQMNIFSRMGSYISLMLKAVGKVFDDLNPVLVVQFADGSKATFLVSGIQGTANIQLELTSAIDADNNDIGLTAEAIRNAQSYSFAKQGDRGLENFIESARRLGVTISSGGGAAGGHHQYATVCEKVGGKYVCTLNRQ